MPDLRMTDGRTPAELVVNNDHRWPDGRIYLPPHLAGRDRRRFLRALLLAEPEADELAAARREDFNRACGQVLCPQCGEPYHDHPADPEQPDPTVACNRERLKL